MFDFSEAYATTLILLRNIVFGQNFEKSFPYAVVLVLLVYGINLYRRQHTLDTLKPLFKSMGVTSLICLLNLVVFAQVFYVAGKTVQVGYDFFGLPHLAPEIWQEMPVWLLLLLTLAIYDFADYWNHRLMHKSLLWPVHAIHHSEANMTGLTTYRVHFLEPFIMGVSYVILLSWLGMPKDVFGYGAIVLAMHNVYVHMDLDWSHGPFRLVLASPRYHRWHHANVPEAYGQNLANFFPIYDVIFGTYYVPGKCDAPLGADGVPDTDPVGLIFYPFKEWARMARSAMLKSFKEEDRQAALAESDRDQSPSLQSEDSRPSSS